MQMSTETGSLLFASCFCCLSLKYVGNVVWLCIMPMKHEVLVAQGHQCKLEGRAVEVLGGNEIVALGLGLMV